MSDEDLEVVEPIAFHTTHELRTRTGDGLDMLVTSGYAEVRGTDLQGNSDGTWNRRILAFNIGPRWQSVDTVPLVSMTSIMNVGTAHNAGWAVDNCEVKPEVGSGFRQMSLRCLVAVRDSDGFMFRVNYHVTQVGRLA